MQFPEVHFSNTPFFVKKIKASRDGATSAGGITNQNIYPLLDPVFTKIRNLTFVRDQIFLKDYFNNLNAHHVSRTGTPVINP